MSELGLDDRLFLYAAGGLEADECEAIEARLAERDPAVRAALERAEAMLARLPLALEPRLPARDVGARLMARARAELEARGGATQERVGGTGSMGSGLATQASAGTPRSAWSDRTGWWAAAAAVLLGLGIAFGGFRLGHRDEQSHLALARAEASARALATSAEARVEELLRDRETLESRLAVLEDEIASLRTRDADLEGLEREFEERLASERALAEAARARAATLESELEDLAIRLASVARELANERASREVLEARLERIPALEARLTATVRALDLVRAPDSALIELVAEQGGERGSASVFWDRGLRHCYLHARSLAPAAGEATYALWVEYLSGRRVRITDFDFAPGEREIDAFADLPVGLGEITRTFVTRETGPDATTPSDEIVLSELVVEPGAPGAAGGRRYERRAL